MRCLLVPILGGAAALVAACAPQGAPERVPTPAGLGHPVAHEGAVYTPIAVGPQGCVLYRIHIEGGMAPAALSYRSAEGRFSRFRPDRCVKPAEAP